ncbi:MAG: hypothetical protein M3M98_04260 [Nitrospirota bacterium]|nr:hypothetical protein [Nitrospirota bacterium]
MDIDLALLQDAKIPAGDPRAFHAEGQIPDVPVSGQLPAGLSRLRDLDDGRADQKYVADAHRGFRELFHRERSVGGKPSPPPSWGAT